MAGSIVDLVERAVGRRDFLRKATNISAAFIGGLFGASQFAYACYECCGLCRDPSISCNWSACACVWCWVCKKECHFYRCSECLMTPFTPPCGIDICKCWNNNHFDACRYCNPDTIPCSKVEFIGNVGGCIPP